MVCFSMYKSVPDSYWVDVATGEAHIVDSYGEPGPIVRKPICVDTEYETLIEGATTIPEGVWVEGHGSQLETTGFEGVQPSESISGDLCTDCEDRYFELLWKRPAEYPAIEVTVREEDAETTYVVADVSFVFDDEPRPSIEIRDEAGRTKRFPVVQVAEIVPHASIPVVY